VDRALFSIEKDPVHQSAKDTHPLTHAWHRFAATAAALPPELPPADLCSR